MYAAGKSESCKKGTFNQAKPSSQISQMHSFDAPCWRAPPSYRTDSGVFGYAKGCILVIRKQSIHSSTKAAAKYDCRPLINFKSASFHTATCYQMHPSVGHTPDICTDTVEGLGPVFHPTVTHSPWKPSMCQSPIISAHNKTHVWWHATVHTSPAHTRRSAQWNFPFHCHPFPVGHCMEIKLGKKHLLLSVTPANMVACLHHAIV
ncbi:hypothetical protein O181_072747 [Austropuccinia psidii MF-1]|uniref:Uncharacterized protein n=1 Tax=Austropuccinia psidii MF-1 TaxID=1389203 RepID=A0A9Q3F7Q5_9BASI|nr:hypothetical protein [Austropuccinia psidii MF-1]